MSPQDVLSVMSKVSKYGNDVTAKDIRRLIKFVEKINENDPDYIIGGSHVTILKPSHVFSNIFYVRNVRVAHGSERYVTVMADLTYGIVYVYSPLTIEKIMKFEGYITARQFMDIVYGFYFPETEYNEGIQLTYNCKYVKRIATDVEVILCSDAYGSSRRYFVISDVNVFAIHIEGKHVRAIKTRNIDVIRALSHLFSI